ncbi:hypothetical protein G0P98_20100 [Yangia sp. PrR004]|nr:hypothetical protein [Salipiger sp. PrR004]
MATLRQIRQLGGLLRIGEPRRLGGILGALLLVTPEDLFSGVIPWLVLISTLAFAAGPALLSGLLASGRRLPDTVSLALLPLVSIYVAYFGVGSAASMSTPSRSSSGVETWPTGLAESEPRPMVA